MAAETALAMRAARVSCTELARLGYGEKEARRMLDPKQHGTRLPKLQQALEALGKRLVVEVRDAAQGGVQIIVDPNCAIDLDTPMADNDACTRSSKRDPSSAPPLLPV